MTISGTGVIPYKNNPWDASKVQKLVIEEGVNGIEDGTQYGVDYRGAFAKYKSLRSVYIPSSVTVIGKFAFYNCTELTEITLMEGLTSIGADAFWRAFKNTGSINIVIPNTVTNIGAGAFAEAGITSVDIPDSVTRIGQKAFADSTVRKITIADSDGDLEINEWAFSNCKSLTEANIPSSVYSIRNNVFYKCTKLTKITIAEGVDNIADGTRYGVDYHGAFSGCTAIKNITLPQSLTAVGSYAFYNCNTLKNITIPSNVETIGNFAFYNCASMTSVTINKGIESIGESAFAKCTKIKDVYFSGSSSEWLEIEIGTNNDPLYAAQIHFNSTGPVETEPPVTEKPVPGDVNGSGAVDAGDATLILRQVVGAFKLSDEQKAIADVNGSGAVDAGDATLVLRAVVGIVKL